MPHRSKMLLIEMLQKLGTASESNFKYDGNSFSEFTNTIALAHKIAILYE